MANILESGFGVLNPTYGSLTKTNFDSEEASFFSQMRKTIATGFSDRGTSANGAMLGIVMRIDGYTNQSGYVDPTSYASKVGVAMGTVAAHDDVKLLQIRVRIPEIHSCLPIPYELPNNLTSDANHDIINLYPIFLSRTSTAIIPQLGSLVWVDFQNRETLQGPIYIEPVDPTAVGTYETTNTSERAARLFYQLTGTVDRELFPIPLVTTEAEAMSTGYLFQAGAYNDHYMQAACVDAMLWIASEYASNISALAGDFNVNNDHVPAGTPKKPFTKYLIFGDASTIKFGAPTPKSSGAPHKSHKVGEDIDIATVWDYLTPPTTNDIRSFQYPIPKKTVVSSTGASTRVEDWSQQNLDAMAILFQAIFDAPDNVSFCPKISKIFIQPRQILARFDTSHPTYGSKTLQQVIMGIISSSSSPGASLSLGPGGGALYSGNHFHLRFDTPEGPA